MSRAVSGIKIIRAFSNITIRISMKRCRDVQHEEKKEGA